MRRGLRLKNTRMLTIADPMTSYTCLTGILFAVDQHDLEGSDVNCSRA